MKILAMDLGRGTQDILLWDSDESLENAVQLILPSPTVILARRMDAFARGGTVILDGVTMGGGPVTKAALRYIGGGGRILATPDAAATFSDDPAELAGMGVRVIGADEARKAAGRPETLCLSTADVDPEGLRRGLGAFGLETDFDAAAIAVQDHGAAPSGVSDRAFRFDWISRRLAERPGLTDQGYAGGEVPHRFTRMRGVAGTMAFTDKLLIMDTGFAALLGSCLDEAVAARRRKILVNAGNGHTLAALVEGHGIRSLMEHHTRNIEPEAMPGLLDDLAGGRLDNGRIFESGGHGAWRDGGDWPPDGGTGVFSLTGPRRRLFAGGASPFHLTAPFGSMMLAGCFGLLAAFLWRYPDLAGAEGERLLALLREEGR